ncbi:hypothetical protein ACWIUD_07025 [Helicobacter sp. 23-1044]
MDFRAFRMCGFWGVGEFRFCEIWGFWGLDSAFGGEKKGGFWAKKCGRFCVWWRKNAVFWRDSADLDCHDLQASLAMTKHIRFCDFLH